MMLKKMVLKLSPPVIGLSIIITMGTILFSYFEDIPYFDAFYWTIVVISTVGFGDITPQTFMGKTLFIILVIFGLAFFGYFVTLLSSLVTEEKLSKVFRYYFMTDGGKLKNHAIIIGWTTFSKYVYEEMTSNNVPAIIIVDEDSLGNRLSREGYKVFVGSVEDINFLKSVGIDDARAVLISDTDPTKIIINILRIRRVNKGIRIVVSNEDPELEELLYEAGANHIVNSSNVIGRLLANYVFEPNAADVAIDLLSKGDLDLMELVVPDSLDDVPISDLESRGFRSKIILIIRDSDRIYYPSSQFRLKKGDVVVVIGLTDDLKRDSRMFGVFT